MYRRGSNGFITEKTILFQGSRGGPTFSSGGGGGVQLLPGGRGVQILISIEPHITCDFRGGGGGGGGGGGRFQTPYPNYRSAHKHEAVILIETGV